MDATELVNNLVKGVSSATVTTLAISPASVQHGTQLALTVNVTGGPTSGDIAVRASATPALTFVTSCTAFPCTISYAQFPGGNYNVTARFAGNSTYSSSASAPVAVSITPEPSQLAILGQSDNYIVQPIQGSTIPYGAALNFYVEPAPLSAGMISTFPITPQFTPATGAVILSDNGAARASYPLNLEGRLVVTAASVGGFAVGKHSLIATYPGDASYSASSTLSPVATPLDFTVIPATPHITMEPYFQYVVPGSYATVQAYVASTGPQLPTGTVSFSIHTASGGTVSVPQAGVTYSAINQQFTATITIPASLLTTGDNDVAATYSGDNNYTTATSTTPAILELTFASTSTSIDITPLQAMQGQNVNISATATRIVYGVSAAGFPTGNMTITVDGAPFVSASTVDNGKGEGIASGSSNTFAVGPHTVVATYAGDLGDGASTRSLTFTVSRPYTASPSRQPRSPSHPDY